MGISRKDVKLEDVANREVLAEQVINNPVYNQAFNAIRASIYANIEDTKFNQNDERDECWRKLQTLNSLQKQIESAMRTAKLKDAVKRKIIK